MIVQPKSLAVALQKNADYPALIVYNAIYDIYIDGRKILSQRPGVAMARGVMEMSRSIQCTAALPVRWGYVWMTFGDSASATPPRGRRGAMTDPPAPWLVERAELRRLLGQVEPLLSAINRRLILIKTCPTLRS